jgi:hypothetical protein
MMLRFGKSCAGRQNMLEVALPTRGIISGPKLPDSRPIENGLDPATHPAGRLGFRRPDGFEHGENRSDIDIRHRKLAELGKSVLFQRGDELIAVLRIPPFA